MIEFNQTNTTFSTDQFSNANLSYVPFNLSNLSYIPFKLVYMYEWGSMYIISLHNLLMFALSLSNVYQSYVPLNVSSYYLFIYMYKWTAVYCLNDGEQEITLQPYWLDDSYIFYALEYCIL